MKFKTVLLFLFTVLIFSGKSQSAQSAVIDKINTKELNNSFVSVLFQDQKGYLWVGTIGGLSRYDGYEFKTFRSVHTDSSTLSSPAITCFAQIDEYRLLIGTRNGLNIYDYRTNNFKRVRLFENPKQNAILSIAANNQGEFLIGTGDGLQLYSPHDNTLREVKRENERLLEGWTIQSLCFDRLGNLWAGARQKTSNGELSSTVFKCDLKSKTYNALKVFKGGSSGHVGISEDYLGHIWVSVDDGLVNIDPSTLEHTYYKAPENFYSNISYCHTKDNMIWQCFWSFGVTAFDIDKKEFKVFRNDPENPKSLMSNKCWALFKDENDILWIGSDIGLQKLTSSRPTMQVIKRNYRNTNASFLTNRISAVLPSQKNYNIIYTGIDGEGFSVYNKQTQSAVNFGPNANTKNSERFVNTFLEDADGSVYLAGQNHFQKLSSNGNAPSVKTFFNLQEHYSASLTNDPVNNNLLWIGGAGELIVFNKRDQTFDFLSEPGGIKGVFQTSFIHQNKIYFPVNNNILVMDAKTRETNEIKIPDVGSLSKCLLVNDTTVYISSQFVGLIAFNPVKKTHRVLFRPNQQLFPQINDILYYKNVLWLATNNGLIKWNPLSREYSELTAEDGLPSETIHQLNVYEGYLYIATQNGLVIFNPDFQVSHFHIPKVEITSLKGTGNNFLKENILNESEIRLNEDQNSFQINFTVFDFTMPEKNSYRFRLLPKNDEWSELGNRHMVYFNDLPPGTYVFELMGANADNTWCAEPQRITIKIIPPFYKSRWFYFACISFVLLASILFVVLRFRSNIRKQKRLEEIITHRTAEIREKRAELLDSISYAERIQKAIFVGEDILHDNLKGSFIINKPKDKVSGDFFWIGKLNGYLIIFAGDCTGHGVPGAMLSIVGTSLLNKVVFEEKKYLPGDILTCLNSLFFRQMNLKESNLRDGMDASVITINLNDNSAWFAGAKNDACIVLNEELTELKAQRNSIGENNDVTFENLPVEYKKGSSFFLFSDGVKDQFGGPKQKKLSSKRFKQILLKTASIEPENQADYIMDSVNAWRSALPQTDDILVIGFKP